MSEQFQYEVPLSYLAQNLLEVVAFLTIAVVGAACARRGPWAFVAVASGLLGAAGTAFYLATDIEIRWMQSVDLALWSVNHGTSSDAIGWARLAGVAGVAVAFVLLARAKTRTTP